MGLSRRKHTEVQGSRSAAAGESYFEKIFTRQHEAEHQEEQV
jgi:hypothetical protein